MMLSAKAWCLIHTFLVSRGASGLPRRHNVPAEMVLAQYIELALMLGTDHQKKKHGRASSGELGVK